MQKSPIVFSLIKEQSRFMTILIAFLTFLSVFVFGITISTTESIIKWNNEWEMFATVQVTKTEYENQVEQIIKNNSYKFNFVKNFSKKEMENILTPWLSHNQNISSYLPKMYEIKFKNKQNIKQFQNEIKDFARFFTYSKALHNNEQTGYSVIFLSIVILVLIIIAISLSISYIAKNTALLHKREIEILNQIGATDSFIVNQMQTIVLKICTLSSLIGTIISVPFLLIIINTAKSTRIGLISMMNLSYFDWILLILVPILIIILATHITKKTTFNILQNS